MGKRERKLENEEHWKEKDMKALTIDKTPPEKVRIEKRDKSKVHAGKIE